QSAAVRFGRLDASLDDVDRAIDGSCDFLLSRQTPEGYWCGELEADTTLESDYIMLHTLLGTGNAERMQRTVREILRHQKEDGGWAIYPHGPSNISATVKAYFALKLMGWSAKHEVLVKARNWILAHGGVTAVNTYTKLYLCFFGQYDYNAVPAIPPEIVLFPKWFYFNIYEISSWFRAIALKRAEKWILRRLEMSDGLGAIYPSLLNTIIALRCQGYSLDDPQVIRALDEFEKLGIEDPGIPGEVEPTFRMQPCMSPVWDTAYAVFAL